VDERTVLSAVDLFPSVCAVAGAKLPDALFDGEDVSAAWFGNALRRTKPLFWEYGRNTQAFKYPAGRDRSPNVAVRDGQWKLLVNADGTQAELYDLEQDAHETRNLAAQEKAVAARLRQLALDWRQALPKLP
jgi:arylsulfatase A-like enzyme